MFEARLDNGLPFKKVLDTLQGIVEEGNFDCSSTAISMQAMDTAHVALISLFLKAEGFDHFRSDRNISLGFKVESMCKIFKCMDKDDGLTMRADDEAESVHFVFESPQTERLSEFELKLMDIDSEHLSVPEKDYAVVINMPAAEFQRICRDLMALGETVAIDASKDGVKFKVEGGIGSGTIAIRANAVVDEKKGDVPTTIECQDPVELQFAISYLNSFSKASVLNKKVKIALANDAPIMVEYEVDEIGTLQFFLAPKIQE